MADHLINMQPDYNCRTSFAVYNKRQKRSRTRPQHPCVHGTEIIIASCSRWRRFRVTGIVKYVSNNISQNNFKCKLFLMSKYFLIIYRTSARAHTRRFFYYFLHIFVTHISYSGIVPVHRQPRGLRSFVLPLLPSPFVDPARKEIKQTRNKLCGREEKEFHG